MHVRGACVACFVQLFAVGGNARGRQFFKQHGWDEIGSDKIEAKVCMQQLAQTLQRQGWSPRACSSLLPLDVRAEGASSRECGRGCAFTWPAPCAMSG